MLKNKLLFYTFVWIDNSSPFATLTWSTGYLNLRMITHGTFMSSSEEILPKQEVFVRGSRQTCIDSACCAIDLIYETFTNYSFFQTW